MRRCVIEQIRWSRLCATGTCNPKNAAACANSEINRLPILGIRGASNLDASHSISPPNQLGHGPEWSIDDLVSTNQPTKHRIFGGRRYRFATITTATIPSSVRSGGRAAYQRRRRSESLGAQSGALALVTNLVADRAGYQILNASQEIAATAVHSSRPNFGVRFLEHQHSADKIPGAPKI